MSWLNGLNGLGKWLDTCLMDTDFVILFTGRPVLPTHYGYKFIPAKCILGHISPPFILDLNL